MPTFQEMMSQMTSSCWLWSWKAATLIISFMVVIALAFLNYNVEDVIRILDTISHKPIIPPIKPTILNPTVPPVVNIKHHNIIATITEENFTTAPLTFKTGVYIHETVLI